MADETPSPAAVQVLIRPGDTALLQRSLALGYASLRSTPAALPDFADTEYRINSQNGEDGILWYIFSLIGKTNRRAVEICAADGMQCNTANLIINDGWEALLFDGDPANVAKGNVFYGNHPDTFTHPPRFVQAWIDAEGVNELVQRNGFEGEIDLLSIDLDGVDYWIWKVLTVVRPRVVVIEAQVIWGTDRAVTVPYRRDFRAEHVDGFGVYSGASLPALVKLGKEKGYRLIGAQRYGFNAFFLRDDIAPELVPEVSAAQCLTHPFVATVRRRFLEKISAMDWVEV